MKLHNILYTAGFICLFIGIPAADRWMQGRTSLITPIVLFLLAGALWYLGVKEDGQIRKSSKKGLLQQTQKRKYNKTYCAFIMAWGKGNVKWKP